MNISHFLLVLMLFVEGMLTYVIRNEDPARSEFTYNIHPNAFLGVYNWPLSYTENCAEHQQQSPVDIATGYVQYNPNLQCPVISYTTNYVRGQVKNTGNFVKFRPEDRYALTVTNAPYRPGKYVFDNFHIHHGGLHGRDWRTQDQFARSRALHPGAEHTLNRYRYDGEVHFVFKNSKYRPGDVSVYSEEDGLVVVAIFVRVLPDVGVEDLRFSRYIEEHVSSVLSINETKAVTVDPGMFFGTSCDFYTYPGSTTVPYCGRSVRWVILSEPVHVTRTAWSQLSMVESRGNYVSLYGNYRVEQPLNYRVIETNIAPNGDHEKVTYEPTPGPEPTW